MPKISELEYVDNLQDGCCFPMVSNGDTRKLSYGQLKDRLQEDIGVEANPELEGDEDELESIRIGDEKFSIPSGGGGASETWVSENFVAKENGKGLSENDYTNVEKQKVASALTEHQSLKTINHQSIAGIGNIEINGVPTPSSSGTYSLKSINGVIQWVLDSPTPLPTFALGRNDYAPIPDTHSTGCDESLLNKTLTGNENVTVECKDGRSFTFLWNPAGYYNFNGYAQGSLSGIYEIENLDFNDYAYRFGNTDVLTNDVSIVFSNCKLSSFQGDNSKNVHVTFNQCTVNGTVSGSYMTFDKCLFTETGYFDALNPRQNTQIIDSFIFNLTNVSADEQHCDGFQTVDSDMECKDIMISGCRFLTFDTTHTSEHLNAGIFLKPDYQHITENIVVDNVVIDTFGSYNPVRVDYKNGNKTVGCVVSNMNCGIYGNPFFIVDDDNTILKKDNSSALTCYVSSVWKEGGKLHLLVSNPTNADRTIIVTTNNGSNTYTINRAYNQSDIDSLNKTYADLMGVCYDREIEINENPDYVVVTDDDTQIRFVDFTEGNIYTKPVTSTSLTASKSKTTYNEGDTLDTSDIAVFYTMDTYTFYVPNPTIDTSDIDMDTAGTYDITVSYSGKSVTISITVESVSPEIEWITDPWSDSGETLSSNTFIGETFASTAGETYVVEGDYSFTAQGDFVDNWIKLNAGAWSYALIVNTGSFDTSSSETKTGHFSAEIECNESKIDGQWGSNILQFQLKNITMGAWSITNLRVGKKL